MSKKFWDVVKNEGTNEGEVMLYGLISESTWWGDEVTPKQFDEDLKSLGNVEWINVRINSGGGDVFAGQAIYTMLKRHSAKIRVHVEGLAASIASIIAMAGDEIIMATGSMMMLHNPAMTIWQDCESDDFRAYADVLDKVKESLMAVYAKRTGKTIDDLASIMDKETWYTAEDAVNEGFATKVDDGISINMALGKGAIISNGINITSNSFHNIPKMPQHQEPVKNNKKEGREGMEITASKVKNEHQDVYNELKNDGAVQELARIQAIDELAKKTNGHDELIHNAKYVEKITAEALALQIINAEEEKRQAALKNIKDDGAGIVVDQTPPPSDEVDEQSVAKNMANAANQRRGGMKRG